MPQEDFPYAEGVNLPRDLPALTGCRFFAALSVLLLHTSTFLPFPQPFQAIALQGRVGVSFFFLLSGFILTHTYGGRFASKIDKEERRRFFVHRVARIYPLHLLALGLITPISLVLFYHLYKPATLAASWLANLALVQTFIPTSAFGQIWNAPAWSISCEMCFYLAFPSIIRWLAARSTNTAILWSYLGSGLLFGLGFAFWRSRGLSGQSLEGCLEYWVYRNPICRFGEFSLGCALYLGLRRGVKPVYDLCATEHARNWSLLAGVVWLSILTGACGATSSGVSTPITLLHTACWFLLPIPAFSVFILVFSTGKSWLSGLLCHPITILLGEASYAMYMLHWVAWGYLTQHPELGSIWKILPLILIVPISILVFRYIETPSRLAIRSRLKA